MKYDDFSPEFHEWLQDGLGEVMDWENPSPPHLGTDSFEDWMQDLADEEHYHPIDRPEERYGVDMYFICSFITGEMQPTFRVLAAEFLKEEPLLADPEARQWVSEIPYPYRKEHSLADPYNFRILGMMLLCAAHGSAYSREILLYLYKTFYRKEYNVLKRMKTLPMREAVSSFLSGGYTDTADESAVLSRIFVMSELLGIELDGHWNRIIQIFNDELYKEAAVWKMIHMAARDQSVLDSRKQNEEEKKKWLGETFPDMGWVDLDDVDSDDSRFQILSDVKNLIEHSFDENGAGTELIYADRTFDLFTSAYKALCCLPEMEEEDLEQIILFAVIRYLSSELSRLISLRNSELNTLLRIGIREIVSDQDMEELTKRQLAPEDAEQVRIMMGTGSLIELAKEDKRVQKLLHNIGAKKSAGTGQPVKKKHVENDSSAEANRNSAEDENELLSLKEQLKETERKLQLVQSRLQGQRELYEAQRERAENLERQLESSRKEHAELVALRHFVHSMDSQDLPDDSVSEETAVRVLRTHKAAVVGGHENWIKKMRRILPEWTVIGADDSLNADAAVTSAEKIYFYTDILGHTMYYKYLKAAEEKKRPFGFLHGTNISSVLQTLYEDLCI